MATSTSSEVLRIVVLGDIASSQNIDQRAKFLVAFERTAREVSETLSIKVGQVQTAWPDPGPEVPSSL